MMALNLSSYSPLKLRHGFPFRPSSSSDRRRQTCRCKAATPEGVAEDELQVSSAQTQLDLLEQLRSSPTSSDTGNISSDNTELQKSTIREQLSQLFGEDTRGEFTLPLGKKLKKNILTVSKRRNIKRQAVLNEVGKRNDSVFFATVGAFVILPPFAILAAAVLSGYVDLMP